ncbi:3-hydroxyacyl-ACP dehydratase FabZ family protein [Salegentibacter sp. F14]
MKFRNIIAKLPYSQPFLFVETLDKINDHSVEGTYTFSENEFFYKGHFKERPVTPGVILTECMAQIGVVCLGIFLLKEERKKPPKIAMSSTEVDFYLPVLPGEKVKVVSEKIYFRFKKLKCEVRMYNADDKLVCKGRIAGMCS